jgi:hypothetical protein
MTLPIRFIDECSTVQILPSSRDDAYVNLFVETVFEYPAPRSNFDCGPITTTLLGIEPGYPTITHLPATREIVVISSDPLRHVDEFPLVLQSCITLNNEDYGCRNSTVFRVRISNPCDTSIIMSNPLPNTLIAPIAGFDSISLLAGPTFWPWDEVFYVNTIPYTNYCKPYSYNIVYKGTDIAVGFINLDAGSGVMSLTPSMGDPLGVVMLTLKSKLYIWPNFSVINYEDFYVEITECIPVLNSNGVELPDRFTKWGFSDAYLDASLILSMFSMSPQCDYLITFESYRHEDGFLTPVSEVSEVAFFPVSKVFAYAKCGPDSDPFDPECAGTPYTKVIPIRIIAKAGLYTIVEA